MIRAILAVILLLSGSLPCTAQQGVQSLVVNTRTIVSVTPPVFSQQSDNECSTGTTCSVTITVAAHDLVWLGCLNYADSGAVGVTSINGSDGASDTFTQGTFITYQNTGGGNYATIQLSKTVVASTGSTVFTCTGNSSMANPVIAVFDYTGGLGSSVNTQLTAQNTAIAATLSTGNFTTTAGTITGACFVESSGVGFVTVGTINSITATHFIRHGGTNWWGCEDLSQSSGFTGAATLTINSGSDQGAAASMSIQ